MLLTQYRCIVNIILNCSAGLQIDNKTCTEAQLRLVGGSNYTQGRVEVCSSIQEYGAQYVMMAGTELMLKWSAGNTFYDSL